MKKLVSLLISSLALTAASPALSSSCVGATGYCQYTFGFLSQNEISVSYTCMDNVHGGEKRTFKTYQYPNGDVLYVLEPANSFNTMAVGFPKNGTPYFQYSEGDAKYNLACKR